MTLSDKIIAPHEMMARKDVYNVIPVEDVKETFKDLRRALFKHKIIVDDIIGKLIGGKLK